MRDRSRSSFKEVTAIFDRDHRGYRGNKKNSTKRKLCAVNYKLYTVIYLRLDWERADTASLLAGSSSSSFVRRIVLP